MNRTNLILIALLGGMLAVWAVQGGLGDGDETTVVAERMFRDFNKEAVDRIEIEGGWAQTKIVYERPGGEWQLSTIQVD